MEPLDVEPRDGELEVDSDTMTVRMGPSHPSVHGTVRIVVDLSGETVTKADVQIGFLHRGFEKMCERGTWTQCLPYVDRLNYASPLLNNIGFVLAVEKMLGAEVPRRCEYYRVILGELARMCDHMVCLAAVAMEMGAFTPFLYLTKAREMLFDILEEETGARVTHSFCRVGGMAAPPTDDLAAMVRTALPPVLDLVRDCEKLLVNNRIFLERVEDIGGMSGDGAMELGWSGPCLRASGVPYDIRRAHPYLVYDELEFDVPVGTSGDCYDRVMVRFAEIHQSARILRQAVEAIPSDGAVQIDDPRVVLPPKRDVYDTIEATIQHFKLVMEGVKVPAGECYSYTEAANGELGFYLVSDGSGTPYRVRIRPPCFAIVQGLDQLIVGGMVPDIVPCFGTCNMIGGECDH